MKVFVFIFEKEQDIGNVVLQFYRTFISGFCDLSDWHTLCLPLRRYLKVSPAAASKSTYYTTLPVC